MPINPNMSYRYMTPNRPLTFRERLGKAGSELVSSSNLKQMALSVIPGGRVVSKTGGLLSRAVAVTKSLFRPSLFAPKQILTRMGVGSGIAVGSNLYSKALGFDRGILPTSNQLYGIGGYAFGGIPGAVGGLVLGGKSATTSAVKYASDVYSSFGKPKIPDKLDIFTTPPNFSEPYMNVSSPPMSYYSGGSDITLPASSTNVSVMGGGGSDMGMQTLLYALLMGGGLGYLFGRKKRKRKIYKSRKHRK